MNYTREELFIIGDECRSLEDLNIFTAYLNFFAPDYKNVLLVMYDFISVRRMEINLENLNDGI